MGFVGDSPAGSPVVQAELNSSVGGMLMKVYFNVEKLKRAVKDASAIVPTRTPKDILYSIKMTARADGQCQLHATDSESSIVRSVEDADVREPGQLLINAVKIRSILNELHGEQVMIKESNRDVTITCGYFTMTIPTANPDDFPSFGGFSSDSFYSMKASSLLRVLRRTIHLRDESFANYSLSGVRFIPMQDGKYVFFGTDARAASLCIEDVSVTGDVSRDVTPQTVRASGLDALMASLADADQVDFFCDGSLMWFRCGHSVLSCCLDSGKFPSPDRVFNMPANSELAKIHTVAAPLRDSIRQAMLGTNAEASAVDFTIKDGSMTMVSSATDVGRASVSMPIVASTPIPASGGVEFRIDPKYPIRALKEAESSDPVEIEVSHVGAMFRFPGSWSFMVMGMEKN